MLAQISGRPMLPMAYAASSAWLVAWDKFVIPRPFARIAIAIGEPVTVARDFPIGNETAVQELQARMERSLYEQFRRARAALD